MNRNDFHSLHLKKVHFDEHVQDLAEFMKNVDVKIESIILEECDIGESSLCVLIEDCKSITTL